MHIGSALLVGIASFMSRQWSSVSPSICLSVNFSCPLHISFINRQVLFTQWLNGSPYGDNVQNSYISPAQWTPRSQFEVKVLLWTSNYYYFFMKFVIRQRQWQRIKTLIILSVQTWICPFILYVSGVYLRLITASLIEVCVCVGGGVGGAGLWSYVHHTVDVKILCSDIVRPSGCSFIFSVPAIFDDPVKIIWRQLPEIDVIAN